MKPFVSVRLSDPEHATACRRESHVGRVSPCGLVSGDARRVRLSEPVQDGGRGSRVDRGPGVIVWRDGALPGSTAIPSSIRRGGRGRPAARNSRRPLARFLDRFLTTAEDRAVFGLESLTKEERTQCTGVKKDDIEPFTERICAKHDPRHSPRFSVPLLAVPARFERAEPWRRRDDAYPLVRRRPGRAAPGLEGVRPGVAAGSAG